jgi:hypothetical protein
MNLMENVGAADIKEPFFDRPEGGDSATSPISEGTRVSLKYHGKQLSAQVTAIERLGTSFVGCVRRFTPPDTSQDELSPGDHIRFRLGDVCQID